VAPSEKPAPADIVIAPDLPALLDPDTIVISPESVFDDPVDNNVDPELSEDDIEEIETRPPVAVDSDTDPPASEAPSPPTIRTEPPTNPLPPARLMDPPTVSSVRALDPPEKTSEPALASLEFPVETINDPDPPEIADPVYINTSPLPTPAPDTGDDITSIAPVGPELLDPLRSFRIPLAPAKDKPVSNTNEPPFVLSAALFPPESIILPPSLLEDSPALSTTEPPTEDEVLRPAANTIEPPCPTVPSPPLTEISPPSVPDPLAIETFPPESVKLAPAESNKDDPTPLLPPAAIETCPAESKLLEPLAIDIDPVEEEEDDPVSKLIFPF
jgi:hypothetical protein